VSSEQRYIAGRLGGLAAPEERSCRSSSNGLSTFLLFGDRHSQIAPLGERHTRYVMLVKVAGTDTKTVTKALIKNARKLPQELYQSLTSDRGKEMAARKRFTLATDIEVYFCDPQSPWQREPNANTNGLLRQSGMTSLATRKPNLMRWPGSYMNAQGRR
jgi:IS30 family transposase